MTNHHHDAIYSTNTGLVPAQEKFSNEETTFSCEREKCFRKTKQYIFGKVIEAKPRSCSPEPNSTNMFTTNPIRSPAIRRRYCAPKLLTDLLLPPTAFLRYT
ncbi:hypothetical protein TNCV_292101 [Trichonephila clavipes]|nr:hypothetical protein TNCV_292101 [Trichonephila clavipes]